MCTIVKCSLFHTDPMLLHPYIPIHFLIEVVWNDKLNNQIIAYVYIPNIEEPEYEIKNRMTYDLQTDPEDIKFAKDQLRTQVEYEIRTRMFDLREETEDDFIRREMGSLVMTFKYKENEATESLLARWNAEGLFALADDPRIPGLFGGLALLASERRKRWDENRAKLTES